MAFTLSGVNASNTVESITSAFGAAKFGVPGAKVAEIPAAEATTGVATKSTAQHMGDRVDISPQAQSKAKAFAAPRDASMGKASEDEEESSSETMINSIETRIKELEKEIKELEQSNLPEKEKQAKLATLNQEMATQTQMLQQLQNAEEGSLDLTNGQSLQDSMSTITMHGG